MHSSQGNDTSESMSRRRPNFSTRTAQEDESRLDPSEPPNASPDEAARLLTSRPGQSYGSINAHAPISSNRNHPSPSNFLTYLSGWWNKTDDDAGPPSTSPAARPLRDGSVDSRGNGEKSSVFDSSDKFSTFSGVFVPTSLNVLSILMFIRFGFILGQAGILGILGLLVISYTINLVTTMSLSAIASNGTVKGGGAYYLISRSLGPEFGGSIGIVFYLGSVLNTGMNAVGLVDCFTQNFGTETGTWSNFLEEGFWWQYLWGTIILILCTGICLAGSSLFSRASNGLLVTLLLATLSIPLSAIVMQPFRAPKLGVHFTGISRKTFLENLKPRLTKGAAGSQIPGRETFQDLFGILFPATGGIFAGASMSGDLKNPSKSIPKGTLYGLAMTFVLYTLVILAMASTLTRDSLYNNADIIQIANLSGVVILLGEFATSFFSALMGLIGSAKLLQAVAKDSLLPGLNLFSKGTKRNDEPVRAIIVTFVAAQLTMLFDINQIASFVTMAYLMTFLVTNLACFLLKIGSAPNFRPSFHYFNWQTAATGTVVCAASMFFVDGVYATGCFGILITLFLLIHYTSPPKPWGDVSQSLIYHQVRKYLLRLKQEHVKFWRPQILLFVTNLDAEFRLVSFCNSLKKGALFVLGHVLVTDDFSSAVPEARRQQTTWTKLVENSKIKAFVNIAISPAVEWGIRNIVLNSGLGGMRPNIVIIDQFREGQTLAEPVHHKSHPQMLPPDSTKPELSGMSAHCQTYVTVLEDLLFQLRINVAVAKGFEDLELPGEHGKESKKYIDLWPIQMSAELNANSESKRNILTTNFDTYTLILQLGCILNTVPSWKKAYKLRVAVFVEYEIDVEDERRRVETLLEKLRIEAEILVFWLASGDLKTYRIIVNGEPLPETQDVGDRIHEVLKDEAWWQDIQRGRRNSDDSSTFSLMNRMGGPSRLDASGNEYRHAARHPLPGGVRKLMQSSRRRRSISSFKGLGTVNLGMQTHRLLDAFVEDSTPSDSSDDSDSSESVSDEEVTEEMHGPTAGQRQGQPLASDSSLPTSQEAVPGDFQSSNIPFIIETGETGSPRIPATPKRPAISRSASSNRFTSSPIPEARVNTDEGAGPSIMFAQNMSPPRSSQRIESIYKRRSPSDLSDRTSASGFPHQASVPLSFNDLPSRAQHLILNELMAKHSEDTAVLFTTLPSPLEGTAESEAASQSYLSDLSVLWQGLPPCLLVHSNSMTVTLNL